SGAALADQQRAALLAFVRQNLANPDLSPRLAAAQLGMSVRTLHARFEQVGETFSRRVLDHRLEGCAEALREPRQIVCGISDVAYRWGFNDLSHFNKAFRARFGVTPSRWRDPGRTKQRDAARNLRANGISERPNSEVLIG